MKVLLTTPFFQFAGGSELETIHTANTFASFDIVNEVHVFVYAGYDIKFTRDIEINSKVKFFRRPKILDNKYLNKLNKEFKKFFNLDLLPFDVLYWKLIFFTKYDRVYIITKTTLNYYLPVIRLYKNKKNILVKYTTFFYDLMEERKREFLSNVRLNIVTSNKQRVFFSENLNLINSDIQEVILFNEDYLLKKQRLIKDEKSFDFGILGRFSEEKQFEHAINLIEDLKCEGHEATLIIRGGCDKDYYNYLVDLVIKKDLGHLITLEFAEVSYDDAYDFFDCFNCFLITSKYEGGPNVGLEVMGYGLPILSYDVGAMRDRLINFPEFIAENQDDLKKKAISILNYDEHEFIEICAKVKNEYINWYSNNLKFKFLNDFLQNSE